MNYEFVRYRLDATYKMLDKHSTDMLFLIEDNKWLPPKVQQRLDEADTMMCNAMELVEQAAHVLQSMESLLKPDDDPGLPHDFGQMCECPDCMEVN